MIRCITETNPNLRPRDVKKLEREMESNILLRILMGSSLSTFKGNFKNVGRMNAEIRERERTMSPEKERGELRVSSRVVYTPRRNSGRLRSRGSSARKISSRGTSPNKIEQETGEVENFVVDFSEETNSTPQNKLTFSVEKTSIQHFELSKRDVIDKEIKSREATPQKQKVKKTKKQKKVEKIEEIKDGYYGNNYSISPKKKRTKPQFQKPPKSSEKKIPKNSLKKKSHKKVHKLVQSQDSQNQNAEISLAIPISIQNISISGSPSSRTILDQIQEEEEVESPTLPNTRKQSKVDDDAPVINLNNLRVEGQSQGVASHRDIAVIEISQNHSPKSNVYDRTINPNPTEEFLREEKLKEEIIIKGKVYGEKLREVELSKDQRREEIEEILRRYEEYGFEDEKKDKKPNDISSESEEDSGEEELVERVRVRYFEGGVAPAVYQGGDSEGGSVKMSEVVRYEIVDDGALQMYESKSAKRSGKVGERTPPMAMTENSSEYEEEEQEMSDFGEGRERSKVTYIKIE